MGSDLCGTSVVAHWRVTMLQVLILLLSLLNAAASTKKFLMVDDHDILYRAGTHRGAFPLCNAYSHTHTHINTRAHTHAPSTKRALAVLEPLQRETPGVSSMPLDKPWETLVGYVSPHVVGNDLYLHYQCYGKASHSAKQKTSNCPLICLTSVSVFPLSLTQHYGKRSCLHAFLRHARLLASVGSKPKTILLSRLLRTGLRCV